MQKKDSNNISQQLEDKIINVAYGDSGVIDWLIVYWKSITTPKVKYILKEYRVTAKAVHKVLTEEAPSQLLDSIKLRTVGVKQQNLISRLISDLFYSLFGNKAIPVTVFGIVLLTTAYFLIKAPDYSGRYSSAEIRLAQKQFKQTMGIIGNAFDKAEKGFNDEVLNNQINKNLKRGYFLVNNILIGG
jgi:hypothetical protein